VWNMEHSNIVFGRKAAYFGEQVKKYLSVRYARRDYLTARRVVGDNFNNGGKGIDQYDTPGVITSKHPGLLEDNSNDGGSTYGCWR